MLGPVRLLEPGRPAHAASAPTGTRYLEPKKREEEKGAVRPVVEGALLAPLLPARVPARPDLARGLRARGRLPRAEARHESLGHRRQRRARGRTLDGSLSWKQQQQVIVSL
eukprot:1986091-Rhodomonas_salina.2